MLTVSDGGPNEVSIAQSRYAPLGSKLEDDRLWTIPVCILNGTYDAQERYCTLSAEKAFEMDGLAFDVERGSGAWIMPNADGAGYYRFSLPYQMWQDLGRAFGQLNAGEKLSTLDQYRR